MFQPPKNPTHRRVRSFGAPVSGIGIFPDREDKEEEKSSFERGSSFDAADSGSGATDEAFDEKHRLSSKIEKNRERLKRIARDQETNVEEFIRLTKGLELSGANANADNPQLQRVRQHFEKKNKRYAQLSEEIQKKLEQLDQKKQELERAGGEPKESNTGNYGSRNVLSTSLSSENMQEGKFSSIDHDSDWKNVNIVGHSKFYDGTAEPSPSSLTERRDVSIKDPLLHPTRVKERFDSSMTSPIASGFSSQRSKNFKYEYDELKRELGEVRAQSISATETIGAMQTQVKNDLHFFNRTLHEERSKYQHLEEQLNDTIDLYQAEIVGLKNELQLVTTRIEYHYNDKFRDLRELLDSIQNRVEKIEANVEDHSRRGHSGGTIQAMVLSSANVLVEMLKIVLFLSSIVLDALRPLTGTRTRAGICIAIWTLLMIAFHFSNLGNFWQSSDLNNTTVS